MKHTICLFIFQTLLTGTFWSPLFAQDNLEMYFQGLMISGGEEPDPFGNDEINVALTLQDLELENTLWESKFLTSTDNQGFFGFEIEDINKYFAGSENGTIILEIGLFPTINSKWETPGNNLSVSYSINKIIRNDSLLFEITRLADSQKLPFSEDNGILLIYDAYPFLFLQGGFIISLDRTEECLTSLRKILTGELSRGMKGGFAVGGYRNKN